ncbi:MAG TPA: imidazole glycerol phosphate synthase subunit HisH [Acidobacteriota bacterium]|nr:imidazole glycerol phosphate synthase subunit HisH [Acidobacteriota bacterium]
MAAAGETIIIDYGMGNLRSVEKAIEAVGGRARIEADPDAVRKAGRLILPGVGAFGDAMTNLRRHGMDQAIREATRGGAPLLGLCLGLQLLFTRGEEFGSYDGLDLIPGRVLKFSLPGLRVPHVGWNQLEDVRPDPLLDGIRDGSYFYFVHSFHVEPDRNDDILSWTSYGRRFCSIACRGNVRGAQFHPEKSQDNGKKLMKNFLAID